MPGVWRWRRPASKEGQWGVAKDRASKKKEKEKEERKRERGKKRIGEGERESYEASTAQDCEFSTLSEQKPKKKSRPRADASGGERLWLRQSPG